MELEIFFLVIATLPAVVGAFLWQRANFLLKNGKKTKAVVFRNSCESYRNGETYYPVIRFQTEKQEWITQQLNVGYNPKKEEGTMLEVLYDPADPTDVSVNSAFMLQMWPKLLVAIGTCGIIFVMLEILGIIQLS